MKLNELVRGDIFYWKTKQDSELKGPRLCVGFTSTLNNLNNLPRGLRARYSSDDPVMILLNVSDETNEYPKHFTWMMNDNYDNFEVIKINKAKILIEGVIE